MMLFLYQSIQGIHNSFLDSFFILISFLGSEPTYILILTILFWNWDKRFGFRLAVLFLFSMGINGYLKDLFQTIRPIGQPGIRSLYLSSATGFSFPSGHSQGAATFYPYLWGHWPRLIWPGIAIIIAIGFSRLYLGLHWPGDILGGYLLGLALVYCFRYLDSSLFKLKFSLRIKILFSSLLPLLFLLVYHSKEGFQFIGFTAGFTLGYFLEDHYLDYQERTSLFIAIKKTILGLMLIGSWILPWANLAHHYPWIYLPVFFAGGLGVSFGIPYLFIRLGWKAKITAIR